MSGSISRLAGIKSERQNSEPQSDLATLVNNQIGQTPQLSSNIRRVGSKPRGANLITADLAVKSHYMLRAIFRKYKKYIKQDEHYKELDKSGRLKSFHPTFEALYRLIIMKKKERDSLDRIHGVGAGMTIFERISEKVSKSVLEEFFKDECCRMLFKRYWT